MRRMPKGGAGFTVLSRVASAQATSTPSVPRKDGPPPHLCRLGLKGQRPNNAPKTLWTRKTSPTTESPRSRWRQQLCSQMTRSESQRLPTVIVFGASWRSSRCPPAKTSGQGTVASFHLLIDGHSACSAIPAPLPPRHCHHLFNCNACAPFLPPFSTMRRKQAAPNHGVEGWPGHRPKG